MRAALALLLMLLCAPTALACSWGPPPTGDAVLWADEQRALANTADYEWGFLSWDDGAFSSVARVFPPIPRMIGAASADGQFVAWLAADAVDALCRLQGARVLATHVETDGPPAEVVRAEPGALAGGARHLAVSMRGVILLYEWGAWDAPARELEMPGLARSLAFSSDGAQLAAADDTREIRVFDLATNASRELRTASDLDRVRGLAFSPNGTHLAAIEGEHVEATHLVVWDLRDEEVYPCLGRRDAAAPVAVAWGDAGLAVTHRANGGFAARLAVYPDAPRSFDDAWQIERNGTRIGSTILSTPDGEAFLVSLNSTLQRIEPEPVSTPAPDEGVPIERTGEQRAPVPAPGVPAAAVALALAARGLRRRL